MTHGIHGEKRWYALIVLCLGVLMIVLDSTIVNVALPSISTDLHFTETALVWVVNAYLLTFGGCLLLGGRLGDLYGQRRMFLAGLVVFTLASLACGLAQSQTMLIAARAVQGLGGAVVSAVSLSLIMNLFTEPGERARAMGVYGFVCAGGGSIGVLLGGLLTSSLSWHWIFLVNLPIGIAVYAMCVALLPRLRAPAGTARLDVAGAVTVTASLMLAVYGIVGGNEAGWLSTQTVVLIGAAVALLALFIAIEARAAHPLMPLTLFAARNVALANVIGVLWAAAMFAWFFLSALYMQRVLGYGPLQVGLAFLPANLIMAAFSLGLSARIVMRFGIRGPIAAGLLDRGLRPRPVFARAGGRRLRLARAARHDAARHRRGRRVQPDAARRDERRRSGRFRARVGDRQHRVHDGRRARPRRAREPRGRPHRRARGSERRAARRTERRLPCGLRVRRGIRCRRRADRARAAHPAAGRRRRYRPRDALTPTSRRRWMNPAVCIEPGARTVAPFFFFRVPRTARPVVAGRHRPPRWPCPVQTPVSAPPAARAFPADF